jgi:hypothetical protein|tara:strand:- start:1011 stop:1325 length:315 start_codon:yes stop_codon:yes gene_type:complete
MANIITSLNSLANSTGERDALIAEIQTGWQLEKEGEKARTTEAERDARAFKNMKSIGSMGKMVAAIPARDYFRLTEKYGANEVKSKEFLRYFQKKFPNLSPNSI